MQCPFKSLCPSRSGWCERDDPDYKMCVPFILTAYMYRDAAAKELVSEIEKLEKRLEELKLETEKLENDWR